MVKCETLLSQIPILRSKNEEFNETAAMLDGFNYEDKCILLKQIPVTSHKAFGVVESVKAVSDLFSPLTATVLEVNERLLDEPELVNDDPYGEGWMVVVDLNGAEGVDKLIDADAYTKLTSGE